MDKMRRDREIEKEHKFRIDAEHERRYRDSYAISPEQLRAVEMFAEDLQLKLQDIYPQDSFMENIWRVMSSYFSGIISDVLSIYFEKLENWESKLEEENKIE